MKLIIDISDNIYDHIKEYCKIFDSEHAYTVNAIANGTPLEAQPTDAVSREGVQDLIGIWLNDYLLDETREALETIMYKVGDMPSIYPERPKGKWITWKEAGNYIPSETRFECSVCHDAAQTLCNGLDLLSPYCPNCGAEMEVEE